MRIFSDLYYSYKISVAMLLSVILPLSISTYLGLRQISSITINAKHPHLSVSHAADRYWPSMVVVCGYYSLYYFGGAAG
jgi:hypothetical protein